MTDVCIPIEPIFYPAIFLAIGMFIILTIVFVLYIFLFVFLTMKAIGIKILLMAHEKFPGFDHPNNLKEER